MFLSLNGLAAWRDFSPPGATFSSGAHVAVVEVDPETGEVRILTYVAVDDCGNHQIAIPYQSNRFRKFYLLTKLLVLAITVANNHWFMKLLAIRDTLCCSCDK